MLGKISLVPTENCALSVSLLATARGSGKSPKFNPKSNMCTVYLVRIRRTRTYSPAGVSWPSKKLDAVAVEHQKSRSAPSRTSSRASSACPPPPTGNKPTMEGYYWLQFGILAIACAGLEMQKAGNKERVAMPDTFISFRNLYLFVYSLMMAGDWLQGPYVYALYQHYGYSTGDIGKLFIAGFGSSMIFGTVVGSMADKYGRKNAALTYCVTYIASCVTKHWSDYNVLMLGRFFGGIATSLLFTSFESWLVAEHFKRGYEAEWLDKTFAKAIFLGNGLVSIVSGLLANFLVTDMNMGPVAPFDAAACFLAIGGVVILFTWSENKGDASESTTVQQGMQQAYAAIASDKRVFYLGAMQSLFEASMYSFVFLWTPALGPNGEDIPHGMIFATMMVACMVGSSVASRIMSRPDTRPEKYMQTVFLASAASLSIPVLTRSLGMESDGYKGGPITFEGKVQMLGFLVFEAMVGIFWPSMMKMRSQYVPEEVRSTVMNFFRIPLNLFVCVILYNVAMFPLAAMFAMCTLFLLTAAALQKKLEQLTEGPVYKKAAGMGPP